ncbi:MAG: TetR/AcrR family transcriptional regulator [Acidobacteriota bacterium]
MDEKGDGSAGRRVPKGDKRQRTRATLLKAARELVREKGYEHTTLQDVAARAGMTSGAIYGNFKNRNDLFLALGQTYWPPIVPRYRPNATFAEKMRALAEATLAAIPERQRVAKGRLTGMAYALNHEEMRAKVQGITATSYELGAEWLRSIASDDELPMPAESLVCVIHVLTEGLVFQRLLTPDLVPDEVFYQVFAALARARR